MRVSQLTLSKKDLERGVLPTILSGPDVHFETKRPPPFTFPRLDRNGWTVRFTIRTLELENSSI